MQLKIKYKKSLSFVQVFSPSYFLFSRTLGIHDVTRRNPQPRDTTHKHRSTIIAFSTRERKKKKDHLASTIRQLTDMRNVKNTRAIASSIALHYQATTIKETIEVVREGKANSDNRQRSDKQADSTPTTSTAFHRLKQKSKARDKRRAHPPNRFPLNDTKAGHCN